MKRTARAVLAALAATAACGSPPTPSAPAAAPPAFGSFGFDVAGMDTSVKPGDDFHAYASAGWLLPPDQRVRIW
jgi:putative endopeptidase